MSGDARAFLDQLEESVWLECLRFGEVPSPPLGSLGCSHVRLMPQPSACLMFPSVSRLQAPCWCDCVLAQRIVGQVERVQAFAADPECAMSVRFAQAGSAAACISVMNGRWYNERKLGAELYDGNRKRAPKRPQPSFRAYKSVPGNKKCAPEQPATCAQET